MGQQDRVGNMIAEKRAEARIDTMADQMNKISALYEEQSQAMQMIWRMDLNFRDVEKSAQKDIAEAMKPPPVAEPVIVNRWGARKKTERTSRMGSKRSSASSAMSSISEAGGAIVRLSTPLTPIT